MSRFFAGESCVVFATLFFSGSPSDNGPPRLADLANALFDAALPCSRKANFSSSVFPGRTCLSAAPLPIPSPLGMLSAGRNRGGKETSTPCELCSSSQSRSSVYQLILILQRTSSCIDYRFGSFPVIPRRPESRVAPFINSLTFRESKAF